MKFVSPALTVFDFFSLDAKIPFKMERFTKVPAKITARGLETQEIDQKRERLVDEHRQRTSDTKFYIKDNMSKLR